MYSFDWAPLNVSLIRSAGIPAKVLSLIRFERTVTIIRNLLLIDEEIVAHAATLLSEVISSRYRKLLRKSRPLPVHLTCGSSVIASTVKKYNELCKKRSLLITQGIKALVIENDRANNSLRNIAKDRRFRDMVRVSTPYADAFYSRLQRDAEIPNQYQRKAYLYLQRATMKVDTAGSYGPIAIGQFDYSSEENLVSTIGPKVSSIMIEPWALSTLLNKANLSVSFTKFFEIALRPQLLLEERKFPDSFKQLVKIMIQYAQETDPSRRDHLFGEMFRLFQDITGVDPWIRSKNRKETATSYEGRGIFFEISQRDFSFKIGGNLRDDIFEICKYTGFLLNILTAKLTQELRDKGVFSISDQPELVRKFESVISNCFEQFLEQGVSEIENDENYCISSHPEYPAPPIFSIDLAISIPSFEALNKDQYNIILSEIHVTPAILTVPLCVLNHEKVVREVASGISRLSGGRRVSLMTKEFDPTRTFKHNYRDFVFKISLEALNRNEIFSSTERELQWFQRVVPLNVQLSDLLFFPLSIGSTVRIFQAQVDSLTFKDGARILWTQEKLPKLVQRIIKKKNPRLARRLSTRAFIKIREEPMPRVIRERTPLAMFSWLLEMWRWKEKVGLPSKTFAWCNPSDKPIFIDFSIPHSLYELCRLRSRNPDLPLILSPLEPSEDNFLLKDIQGKYSSEIRCMAFPIASKKTDVAL